MGRGSRRDEPIAMNRTAAVALTVLMLLQVVPLTAPQAVSGADPEQDGVISAGEYEHSMVFDTDQFYVHWTINGSRIYLGLRAATTGYLALGFDPKDELKDVDLVYGRVTAGPNVDVRDTWSSTKTGPAVNDTSLGGTMDIENEDGSEAAGYTTIEFRRDLDTGDAYDLTIPFTGSMKVVWIMGVGDAWDSGVAKQDEGKLELGTTPPPPPSGELDGVVSPGEYGDNHTTFDGGNFELYYRIVDPDIYIALRAQVTGWVSLGFEPTNQMLDADMLFTGVGAAVAEQSDEEKEALRLDNLKRQYQNAIGRLPYGIPSKELQDREWVDLADALATGPKKLVHDGQEITGIDGRWYFSDADDSSTFLKEHGAKVKEVAKPIEPTMDNEALLKKLEERFIMGEISEESYQKLVKKYGE